MTGTGRKRWGRRAGVVAVGVLAAAGGIAVAGSPAQAAPSACTFTWGGGKSLTTACAEGDGQYRTKLLCGRTGQIPSRLTYYGPWVAAGPGTRSVATCLAISSYAISGSIEAA
ncbi:hypothetical protein [Actinomadura parmotrematis]|uniref:Ig-like domain-containing protein n=1 Tax=Actinomadura parmotrematis TaxID=2864039 RepID=A0ABS7FVY9_9ACTN|nr:hypothetical protein [Actinomadura parmotrematis]MBW8484589.1 hypothetical protein [Actinomadura parmotrematis]